MTATRRFAADPCHGCVRVGYQTMESQAGEIGNGSSPLDLAVRWRRAVTKVG
jgi:hypothetical protein